MSRGIGFRAAKAKLLIEEIRTLMDCMYGVAATTLFGTGLVNSIVCNSDSAAASNFQRIIATRGAGPMENYDRP
jgi:hypothetical protein